MDLEPDDSEAAAAGDQTATGPPAAGSMVPTVRQLVPKVIVAGVLPAVGYSVLRPHVHHDATALATVMVFPLADIALERRRHGRFEPIGVIALIGIAVGIAGALLLHGNATLLKIRESMLTAVFGLVCLVSLFARRPAMFFLARAFATGGDPAAVAEFDTIWEVPVARTRFRRVTFVWGIALLAECAVRVALAFAVSTQRFLMIAPVIGWGTIGLLIWYSNASRRAGEREALAG